MLPPEKLAIAVRRDDVSASVAYAPRAAALSAFERDQLARFVARSGAAGGDRAVIALSPAGGRALAERRVQLLARDLHRHGLSVARSFGPGEPNAATITITRMVAVAPDCPQWQDLMQRSQVDEYQPKLGCITASSLATSVHRPMDLVSGRPTGPSDGVVIANGIDALRAGKFDPPVTATGTGSPQAGQTGQQGQQAK
jgi:pilus biogenesis lipoprotein CpaD